MTTRLGRLLVTLAAGGLLSAGCGGTSPSAPPAASAPAHVQLFVFTDKPPAVTVIEPRSGRTLKKAEIAGFGDWTWAWNDDNNYSDGQSIWLGLRNPNTDEVVAVVLNLDSLEVTKQVALGRDRLTVYIGKATSRGLLDVSKMGSGQVLSIDTRTARVVSTWNVPVNGDVACDADIGTGPGGAQHFYYPTRKGDTVVSLNPETGAVEKVAEAPRGSNPFMLTAHPNGTVWVQESGSNTNAVLDGTSLALIKRIPVGKGPITASFSPDGKLAFITHTADPIVAVIDVRTLEVTQRLEIGTYPTKVVADPGGGRLYAMVTQEKAVAVVDTASWTVTSRIALPAAPASLFVRKVS